MGLLDKAKFWKKESDSLGDLSDLGDFGLDDKSGHTPGGDLGGGLGDDFNFPSLDEPPKPGMQPGIPSHIEEVHPTSNSKQMSDQLGIRPAPVAQSSQGYPQSSPQMQQSPMQYGPQQMQQQPAQPQPVQQYAQAYPANYHQAPAIEDVAKELEIVHAKLDAIKSTLDSINQRLATIERIASGDNKPQQRYAW